MSAGEILVVDDEPEMLRLLVDDLGRQGFAVAAADSAAEALAVLAERDFDAVLTDLVMPHVAGTELCRRIGATRPGLPVVVMTAFGSLETAVDALRAGAFDFITKPLERELLLHALRRAVEHRQLRERLRVLANPVAAPADFAELVGTSSAIRRVRTEMTRIAGTDATVLITGESGTGKELIARALVRHGRRRDRPFVAVNCAALPATLLESELFGHARGAFTDAHRARAGLFREADHGTLFLDEVGDIDLPVQPKLLRVLDNRAIRPVGADREESVDVRVIAATHRDLALAVADGRFRQDLFYRIQVLHLHLPPLRERGTDVLDLAQRFVGEFAAQHGKQVTGFEEATGRRLLDYPWPGNVRELRNAIESAVVLSPYERIRIVDLPEPLRDYRLVGQASLPAGDPAGLLPLDEVERRYILQVLQAVGGNRSRAAQILGLDRKTLYRKLQRFDAGA